MAREDKNVHFEKNENLCFYLLHFFSIFVFGLAVMGILKSQARALPLLNVGSISQDGFLKNSNREDLKPTKNYDLSIEQKALEKIWEKVQERQKIILGVERILRVGAVVYPQTLSLAPAFRNASFISHLSGEVFYSWYYEYKFPQEEGHHMVVASITQRAYRPFFELPLEGLVSISLFQKDITKLHQNQEEFLKAQSLGNIRIMKEKIKEHKSLLDKKTKSDWIFAVGVKDQILKIPAHGFYTLAELIIDPKGEWVKEHLGLGTTMTSNKSYPWQFRLPSIYFSVRTNF